MWRLFPGLSLGSFLMAASAWAGAAEFPPELRFLAHLPLLMKDAECLENGKKVEEASCEIRIQTAGRGGERTIYIVVYMPGDGYFISSGTLITSAASPPRALPDDLEVITRGTCESEVLKITAPTPCDLVALGNDDGRETFYFRLLGSVPGGALFSVLPGELIFPSSPVFFKK